MKPLVIPKSKQSKYIVTYCYHCKTNVRSKCLLNGKQLSRCPNGHRHRFKAYVPIPGSKNERKNRTMKTRDIDQALLETMRFQNEVKRGYSVESVVGNDENFRPRLTTDLLFIEAAAKYLAQSQGEEVPYQLKIKRKKSQEHTNDIERVFATLIESWHWKGRDVKCLKISDLDPFMGGEFLEFMQKQRKYQNRTINKYIGNLKPFIKWYSKEYGVPVNNWLEGIAKLPENYNPEVMSFQDFEKLISKVKPENGIQYYQTGAKETRNFYRPYLIQAFNWGVHSGLRREELISLKHSDVIEKEGKSFIRIENFKVNRIQGRHEDREKTYVIVPVTEDIKKLLLEADHDQFKNTDQYIIAPKIQKNRVPTMRDAISRGFNHFYKLDHPEGQLTFKNLRKTYLTNLNKYLGNEATGLTHSNQAVLDRHYLNKEKLAEKAMGFGTYSEEIREKQIQGIRESRQQTQEKQNEKGVGK